MSFGSQDIRNCDYYQEQKDFEQIKVTQIKVGARKDPARL